ncbi:MAG: transglycosylase family protein [Mycobacterium sp.]
MYRNTAVRRVAQYAKRCRSLLTSGVLAGGVVLLLGSSAALAHADDVDWDAVAQCESGGNWTADTGNGFYGGLQLKESTWKQFGGVGSPASAPRAEQIAVADRVLAAQGPRAWPKCSPGQVHVSTMTAWFQNPLRSLVQMLWSSVPH